jgi:hypothetical protein
MSEIRKLLRGVARDPIHELVEEYRWKLEVLRGIGSGRPLQELTFAERDAQQADVRETVNHLQKLQAEIVAAIEHAEPGWRKSTLFRDVARNCNGELPLHRDDFLELAIAFTDSVESLTERMVDCQEAGWTLIAKSVDGLHPTDSERLREFCQRAKHLKRRFPGFPSLPAADPYATTPGGYAAAVQALLQWCDSCSGPAPAETRPEPSAGEPVRSGADFAGMPRREPGMRPAYLRDHLWLQWSEQGSIGPAAIRDRWNSLSDDERKRLVGESSFQKIAPRDAGREVVKSGIAKAKTEIRESIPVGTGDIPADTL